MHCAILAETPVQGDESTLEALADQRIEAALGGIERQRVDAAAAQGIQHHPAALQRDRALRRFATEENGDFSEVHAASPTMRTSGTSSMPCFCRTRSLT